MKREDIMVSVPLSFMDAVRELFSVWRDRGDIDAAMAQLKREAAACEQQHANTELNASMGELHHHKSPENLARVDEAIRRYRNAVKR